MTGGCELDNGGCQQLCLSENDASYICKCYKGYDLDATNVTNCKGEVNYFSVDIILIIEFIITGV